MWKPFLVHNHCLFYPLTHYEKTFRVKNDCVNKKRISTIHFSLDRGHRRGKCVKDVTIGVDNQVHFKIPHRKSLNVTLKWVAQYLRAQRIHKSKNTDFTPKQWRRHGFSFSFLIIIHTKLFISITSNIKRKYTHKQNGSNTTKSTNSNTCWSIFPDVQGNH